MAALFLGSETAHGTHGEPYRENGKIKWEIKKTARTVKQPVTTEMWSQHLSGARPLGVIPFREDGTCTWGSIDIDEYESGDMLDLVKRAEGLGLVPVRSKSGGLHLFLFLEDWTPVSEVRTALRSLARQLGLKNGVEIFPKQERGFGNWIIVPYFGGTYGGKLREQVGVKKTGAEMTLDEFLRAAENARVGADWVAKQKLSGTTEPSGPFAGAPECLRRLAVEGVPEGMRNDALFAMGVYARRAYPQSWKEKVAEFNHSYVKPPLSLNEVNEIVKSLGRRVYDYKRDGRPVCEMCDRPECKGPLGIAAGRDRPVFEHVVITEGDEPMWTIRLAGVGEITVSSNEVLSQRTFNRLTLARLRRAFRPIKEVEWIDLINEAAARAEIVQTERATTLEEQLREKLEDFLTNRLRGKRREDLFSGRPYEDEEAGVHLFRLEDFQRFLLREDSIFRRDSRVRLGRLIRVLGGGYKELTIEGRGLSVWWLPNSVVRAAPVFEPAPMGGSPL
jgi:hypothetical protein